MKKIDDVRGDTVKEQINPVEWYFPSDEYTPNLTVENWLKLLKTPEIFNENSLFVMKCIDEMGGQATCQELAERYGKTEAFYQNIVKRLAKRIQLQTGCTLSYAHDDGKYWYDSILFLKKQEETSGVWVWKMRDELKKAWEIVKEDFQDMEWFPSLSDYDPCFTVEDWLSLMQDPEIFNEKSLFVMKCIYEMGGQSTCKELSEKYGNSAMSYNASMINLGKRIYKKADCPLRCEENGEKHYWSILFVGKYASKNQSGGWVWKMRDELKKAWEILHYQKPILSTYTESDFLKEVYMTEKQYHTLTALLKRKKNIILQGSAGVGKTFSAKRLAYSMMGVKDESRIEFVQFHQSYSYEDFIMGYRPDEKGGFLLKEGCFYEFCKKAEQNPEEDYFFIIDEINRGNLSKIFGELLVLLENDKRGSSDNSVRLVYKNELFSIPKNLYLIGMMNTADRSLSMIDYALRRRFSFFEMYPAFDTEGFQSDCRQWNSPELDTLIQEMQCLNEEIKNDSSLGKGFCIGHSYFCNLDIESSLTEQLYSIVAYDIFPLLQEYWFDEVQKAEIWRDRLLKVIGAEYDG